MGKILQNEEKNEKEKYHNSRKTMKTGRKTQPQRKVLRISPKPDICLT